tara:strand:+ start:65 stop:289 length:225 start_codon:yes stop_codon:yes gene_type:complete
MSDQYQDEILKDISKNIKDIKEQLITKNKIDSINLVFNLASNDTFKRFNEEEIKKVMPKFNKVLNAIHKNIYDN